LQRPLPAAFLRGAQDTQENGLQRFTGKRWQLSKL
jgi:hypothetical protein